MLADGDSFDLVVHLGGDWERYHRRPMLEALAESMRDVGTILCVERPICPMTTPWRHPRKAWDSIRGRRAFRRLSDNLFILTPWVFVHDQLAHGLGPLVEANRWLLKGTLASAMTRAGMGPNPRFSWIYNPAQVDFVGLANERGHIYECLDDYPRLNRGSRYSSRWITQTEQDLVARAEVVFCTALRLRERLAQFNPETYYVPNGVRLAIFERERARRRGEAVELEDVPRPRIGFVGNVDPLFFDVELLQEVAERRTDWSFVIFGRISSDARADRLLELPNVWFKGFVAYERLPAIIPGFDVGVIPFRKNPVTDSLNPLKLYEYMAGGCPVVSTSIPEVLPFQDWIGIADTAAAFVDELEGALARSSESVTGRWRRLAENHDWSVRVEEMIARVSETLDRTGGGVVS